MLGKALIDGFTQLAGTELSSSTGFRNKVAGIASKAPRVPRMHAQKISETRQLWAEEPPGRVLFARSDAQLVLGERGPGRAAAAGRG